MYDCDLQSGYLLGIKTILHKLPVLLIEVDGVEEYVDRDTLDIRRAVELQKYEVKDGAFSTLVTFDYKKQSVQTALFSIYTTSFIIVLLVVSYQLFYTD